MVHFARRSESSRSFNIYEGEGGPAVALSAGQILERGGMAMGSKRAIWVLCGLLGIAVLAPTAPAQKGKGDEEGMARSGLRPEVVSVSGKLNRIKDGPCSKTTGRSPAGIHFFLDNGDGEEINLHLGPSAAVSGMIAGVETGQKVTARAFRTPKLDKNEYVAVSFRADGEKVTLRDSTLRPVWAGRPLASVDERDAASSRRSRGRVLDRPLAERRIRYDGDVRQRGYRGGRGRGLAYRGRRGRGYCWRERRGYRNRGYRNHGCSRQRYNGYGRGRGPACRGGRGRGYRGHGSGHRSGRGRSRSRGRGGGYRRW